MHEECLQRQRHCSAPTMALLLSSATLILLRSWRVWGQTDRFKNSVAARNKRIFKPESCWAPAKTARRGPTVFPRCQEILLGGQFGIAADHSESTR